MITGAIGYVEIINVCTKIMDFGQNAIVAVGKDIILDRL